MVILYMNNYSFYNYVIIISFNIKLFFTKHNFLYNNKLYYYSCFFNNNTYSIKIYYKIIVYKISY